MVYWIAADRFQADLESAAENRILIFYIQGIMQELGAALFQVQDFVF